MRHFFKSSILVLTTIFLFQSCSKDDNEADMSGETYDTSFKITDAPIDNANVEGVFVTITDVKVDGNSLEGFNATTVNLAALVNGQTATLGNLDLAARTYSNMELVLDYETDVEGNSPGCYVALANGAKDKLTASANTISVNDSFEVFANTTNEVVFDFDLRKTIKEEQGTLESDFEFVSMSELSAGIRTVNEETTGEISGAANDAEDTSDRIVVYAYEKGTFNAETETNGQGESNVTFKNAVTSSVVNSTTGSYTLSFLEEGEYELVFASYNKDGDVFYFNALLEAESTTGLNLGAINVSSALQISANVTITGTK
ncbi:MAG: DUF4382 domain-containing protein [Muriicola sp.]|nr:DUF4382 domain-containing protein [Muriicola sp.]MBT8283446.1 DUF4382 domain-containing protein [Muriicola sp.]NNK10891.1 DUF4382 domain-containing protein [Flavobacteriaceae bacterium]